MTDGAGEADELASVLTDASTDFVSDAFPSLTEVLSAGGTLDEPPLKSVAYQPEPLS